MWENGTYSMVISGPWSLNVLYIKYRYCTFMIVGELTAVQPTVIGK